MSGTSAEQKKRFNSGIARIGGGGLPLPEFFCALFLLKEKVSSMVATAEKSGESCPNWGVGGGVWLIGAMPELKRFFCSDVVPYSSTYLELHSS